MLFYISFLWVFGLLRLATGSSYTFVTRDIPPQAVAQTYDLQARSLAESRNNVTQDYLSVPERYAHRFNLIYQLEGSSLSDAELVVLQSDVIPAAMRRVSRMLDLKRSVLSNLTLTRTCKTLAEWRWGQVGQVVSGDPQFVTCIEYNTPSCGYASVPVDLLKPARLCTDQGPEDCTDLPFGTGAPDSDTFIFVTSKDADECEAFSTIEQTAVGKYCYRDQFDRPIAMNLNVCPGMVGVARVADLTSSRRATLISSVVRAMLHGLGLDHDLLPFYRDPSTNAPLVSRNKDNEPTGSTSGIFLTVKAGDGATSVSSIVLPRALNEAKSYLQCSNLEGLETSSLRLGSSALFFANRIYEGELMAAAAPPTGLDLISNITLALLYDSGWYLPRFDLASYPRFTRGAKCPVATYQCSATAQADPDTIPYPFCKYSAGAAKTCDAGRQQVVTCPSESGPFDDGCYVQAPVDNSFVCSIPSTQLDGVPRQRRSTFEEIGMSFGLGSVCIETTLSSRKLSDGTVLTFAPDGAGCFRARCTTTSSNGVTRTSVEVFITDISDQDNGGAWVGCPFSGSSQTTDLSEVGFTGGRLGPCPDPAEVCPYLRCPNNCNGNGVCDNNSDCRCDAGWSGADCSRKECAVNADCGTAQACDREKGYCIAAAPPPAPPPSPPPPPAANTKTYTLESRVMIGPMKGCSVILDSDGDGRQQDPAYDPILRELVVISDSTGAFELDYSGTFLRPGVLPRNLSLIKSSGQPQLLVQPSSNCRDQYGGSLLWGSLKSLLIPQIFPELTAPPLGESERIKEFAPEVFLESIVDPMTTLVSEVYLLLVRNYTSAGLIKRITRDQIYSEASYRVAIALDNLMLDTSYDLTTLNSSVVYRETVIAGKVRLVPLDLLTTVQFGKIDFAAAVYAGFTSFLIPYAKLLGVGSVLSHLAAIAGGSTAATAASRVGYRAAVTALAEGIISIGDGSVVPGLDENLLTEVVKAGGWAYVRPSTKLAILIRAQRRLDLTNGDVIKGLMYRAASLKPELEARGEDVDTNRWYFENTGLSFSDLAQSQVAPATTGRRLQQSGATLDRAITSAGPVSASFYNQALVIANRPQSVGYSTEDHGRLALATLSVVNQAATTTVATYMTQVRAGLISQSSFESSTSASSIESMMALRTAPGVSMAKSDAEIDKVVSGEITPATRDTTVEKDETQSLLIRYWWVAAGGLLLIVFICSLLLYWAMVRYRKKYKNSTKEEMAQKAAEEKRRRQEEGLMQPYRPGGALSNGNGHLVPVKPQPSNPAVPKPATNGNARNAPPGTDLLVVSYDGTSSNGQAPSLNGQGPSAPALPSGANFRSLQEHPPSLAQAERERDLLISGSLLANRQPPGGFPPPSYQASVAQPLVFPGMASAPVLAPPPAPSGPTWQAPPAQSVPNFQPPPAPSTSNYLSANRSIEVAPQPVARGPTGEPIYALSAPPSQPSQPAFASQSTVGAPSFSDGLVPPVAEPPRAKPPPTDFRVPAPPSLPPPPPPVLSLSTATTLVAATMLKLKSRTNPPPS